MMKIALNHYIPRVYFIQQHFPKVESEQITLWPVGFTYIFPGQFRILGSVVLSMTKVAESLQPKEPN